jgi:type I restriction enzyme S subunit
LETTTTALREGLREETRVQTELGLLPDSWPIASVEEHFEIQLGKMLSARARRGLSPRPYLRNANVQWGTFDLRDVFEMDFDDREFDKFQLIPGDILVCEGGEPGRTAIWQGQIQDCCYQKALHRLRPRSGRVSGPFFTFWMETAVRLLGLYAPTVRTTIAHLPAVKLAALKLPVPPRDEQGAIAHALSALKSRVVLEERRVAALHALKAAAMAKVFREGLRGEAGQETSVGAIPASWRLMPLVELAAFPRGLVDPRVEPYASMIHVGPENVESETSRLLPVNTAKEIGLISGKYLFEAGDVIYSKIRPYRKKVTQAMGLGLCSADMYPLRPIQGVPAAFFVAALLSDACTSQIVAHQDRTGIPKVNRDQLAGVLVPVPSDPLDRERIATIFDSMSCAHDRAAERVVRLRSLFDVTLQQLMTGALRLGPKSDA